MVNLGPFYEFFTSDCVYLSGCLTAFNFEKWTMHFIWLWKVIYILYIYIYIFFFLRRIYNYILYRSFLGYFSSESTMFTSLPPRRLRWSAGVAGRSSSNRVPAPHSGMSLLVLPKGVGVRVALPGQRQICGSSFSKRKSKKSSARISWCQWPRALEGRPLWGRAVYTASYGARFSSVPSGDQSSNPASVPGCSGLQRALLSVSSALRGSLEQLDRPSPAGPPLQGTELAALSIPEASLERLVPLVGHLALWEPLPCVSHWVLLEQTLVL